MILIFLFAIQSEAQMKTTPKATEKPFTIEYHGEKFSDPYHWLKEKSNPEVIQYLNSENDYYNQHLSKFEKIKEQMYQQMISRIKEDDETAPYQMNEFWYYSKTEKGLSYDKYFRKPTLDSQKSELLLDVNELAKDQKYMSVSIFEVSPNAKMLAYSFDNTGFRNYHLVIKDLESQKIIHDLGVVNSFEWGDDQTVYYTIENESKRPYQVYKYNLSTKVKEKIYEDLDGGFWVWVSKSMDDQYLWVVSASAETTEYHMLNLKKTEPLKLFKARAEKLEYYLEHFEGEFYIRTNLNAPNFKIMKSKDGDLKNWKDVVPYNPEVKIEDITSFKNFLTVSKKINGLNQLSVYDHKTLAEKKITFQDKVYLASFHINKMYETQTLRYSYSSPIQPPSVFEYSVANEKSLLIKEKEVPNYDKNLYGVDRIWVEARDKAKVPVTLIYKKGNFPAKHKPFLLYGYGSYGVSMEPGFSIGKFSLIDHGFVFAIAHIRGGGDLGETWYLDGKFLKKKNSFYDFIDVADHIVKEGWSRPDLMGMEGGSAGGLLMGAVLNLRPNLVKAAHLAVPFVDVIHTMMDTSLPLTTQEYHEWGDPNKKEYFDYMKSYSPYDNIQKANYPHMLVTTSLNDSQVMYWEPAKWVAKMRTLKTDSNDLLFRVNMSAGHGGSSGRYDRYKEAAEDHAFFVHKILNSK